MKRANEMRRVFLRLLSCSHTARFLLGVVVLLGRLSRSRAYLSFRQSRNYNSRLAARARACAVWVAGGMSALRWTRGAAGLGRALSSSGRRRPTSEEGKAASDPRL